MITRRWPVVTMLYGFVSLSTVQFVQWQFLMNQCNNLFLIGWESFSVMKTMFSFLLLILFIANMIFSQQKKSAIQFTFIVSLHLGLQKPWCVFCVWPKLLESRGKEINHFNGRRSELRNVSEEGCKEIKHFAKKIALRSLFPDRQGSF